MTASPQEGQESSAAAAPMPAKRTAPGALKLLFLLPFAPDLRGSHGGSRATAAMIDMLSEDHRLCVVYFAGAGDPPPRELPKNCEQMVAVAVDRPHLTGRSIGGRLGDAIGEFAWRAPDWVERSWSRDMAARVGAIAAEFEPDVVHFEFHVMAQYVPTVRAACPRAKCVVTEHEPGITADERSGKFLTLRQRLRRLARARAWRRYERRALSEADAIIVFTQSDAAALTELVGSNPPITVIPLRLPSAAPPQATGAAPITSDFLFVGNFGHPPNADAARRLVRGIFPLILRALPDATLIIVGTNPPEDVIAAGSDRVTITGWVDDPAVYLAGAAVVLVPLRQGGGLRVKMLEACAAGKAIVASAMAVEGLALADGQEVVLAESDEQFAEQAVRLMASPGARARLEEASLRWSAGQQGGSEWSAQYAAFHAGLFQSGKQAARGNQGEGR